MTVRRCSERLCVALILLFLSAALMAQAETPARQKLFHVERSKNANIVQYDVQIDADGKLFRKKPVVAYWLRLAEQGQEKKLSWIQKTFAYGFDVKLDRGRESAELKMKADVGRRIEIVRRGDFYRATLVIDGALSYFDKMYIDSDLEGWTLTVHYVELFGVNMETGEASYEKFTP